jgi:hypothetical protein
MSLWLARQKRKNPDFVYLIVPELHADGALHFHALMRGYTGSLRDSHAKTVRGQTRYFITGFRSGRTDAVKLDENYDAIAGYLMKYITKDMPLLYGKKRYWTSQNLEKPKITANGVFHFNLQQIIKNYTPDFINDYYEIQTHKKALNVPLSIELSDRLL